MRRTRTARRWHPPCSPPGPVLTDGPGPLELRIYNGGSRWLLQPYAVVEVWAGASLVGMLSGRAVTLIVEHHLAAAALAAAVQTELTASPPASEAAHIPRRPPQAVIPDAAQRAALRTSRHRRSKDMPR